MIKVIIMPQKFLSDKLEGTFFMPFLLVLKFSYIFVP